MNENQNGELTIRKVLESEVGRYVTIIAFFVPLITFAWNIKSDQQEIKADIALIKQNHLTHTEKTLEELAEQKSQIIELQKDQIETDKQMLIILERLTK